MSVPDRLSALRINNPKYTFVNSLRFVDYYKLIHNYEFQLVNKHQKPIFARVVKRKKCCFCGRSAPFVSFKRKSHVIPEAFGNKWLFTNEECNECNREYGRQYENELANMFDAQRLLGRVPKKGGFPKIRVPGRRSSMQVVDNNIAISIEDSEKEFELQEVDNETVRLSVPAVPYYPIKAIKSIAHSLWLILDIGRRAQYRDILKWIKSEVEVMPLHYYIGLVPGPGKNILGYSVWEKILDDKRLASLIVKFYFSNTFLFWEVPDIGSNIYLPGILPEIEVSNFPPFEPQVHFVTAKSDIQLRPRKISFTFQHEGKEEQTSNSKNIKIKDASGLMRYGQHTKSVFYDIPRLVKLIAIKGEKKSEINYSYATFKLTEFIEFLISGGHLAGKIEGKISQKNVLEITIKPRFDKLPINIAKRNFVFFQLVNSGCSLDIIALNQDVPTIHLDIKRSTGGLNDDIWLLLEYLDMINNAFGVDIRYSSEFTDSEVRDISYIANGIRYGQYTLNVNNFQLMVNANVCDEIINLLKNRKETLCIELGDEITIGGIQLETGKLKIYAKNPRLSGKRKLNETTILVDIAADLIVFRFEKFMKSK